MENAKIAIIGSGISGLTAAYLLNKKNEVTLFEANDYLGGHTNTIDVSIKNKTYPVDTGFIVFNERTYPNFIKLLDQLSVEKQISNMSFSFSSKELGVEYSGDTLNSLFAQRKNLFQPKFYKLIKNVCSFNQKAKAFIASPSKVSLKKFVENQGYGSWFLEGYLHPLASAIWSTPTSQVGDIPAQFILGFYKNHGLLDIFNKPQWYVVKGGSKTYAGKILKTLSPQTQILKKTPALKVKRSEESVQVFTEKDTHTFDAVLFACHSDEALSLLENPSNEEQQILGAIPYQKNKAILHTDVTALPSNRRAWASWNYVQDGAGQTFLTYYMNKLQSIQSDETFCVTLGKSDIDPKKTLGSFDYAHPVFNEKSVAAKNNHALINGKNRTFYAGAYWGNGFHEDGVVSALKALEPLGMGL